MQVRNTCLDSSKKNDSELLDTNHTYDIFIDKSFFSPSRFQPRSQQHETQYNLMFVSRQRLWEDRDHDRFCDWMLFYVSFCEFQIYAINIGRFLVSLESIEESRSVVHKKYIKHETFLFICRHVSSVASERQIFFIKRSSGCAVLTMGSLAVKVLVLAS